MIELHDLHVHYGAHAAVSGLTLSVPEGSLFGLLGPNGAGKSSTIRCIATTQAPTSGRVVVGGFDAATHTADIRRVVGVVPQGLALYETAAAATTRGASAKGAEGLQPPLAVNVEEVVAAGPTAGFNSYAHTFAGMLMQFLLLTSSGQAKLLFAERAAGTLDRLRMTTARPAAILLGSGAAVAVVSFIASVVVFAAGVAFAGIELRSGPLAFTLVLVGQAVFVGSFALFLAGLADSDKQIDAMGTLVILFLCFVSGAWVPPFMLPGFFQTLGPLIPTRWVLDGMAGATWRGLGLMHALQCTGVLFVFSALFAGIGIRRFRWS